MHAAFEHPHEHIDTAGEQQLISLAVDTRSVREEADLVWSLLFSVKGVEAAEPDLASAGAMGALHHQGS